MGRQRREPVQTDLTQTATVPHYLSEQELSAINPGSPFYRDQAEDDSHEYPRAAVPARQLLSHLGRTGLGPKYIREFNNWLAEQSEDTTAETLYERMVATQFKPGTIRRACKWIWGPTAEPESLTQQAPADEILRLRSENERLIANVQALSADKLGLTNQNHYLREQLDEATRKISFLSVGRSQADLDTLKVGVNPPNQPEGDDR